MVDGVAVIFPSSVSVISREKTNKSPLINMLIHIAFPLLPFKEISMIYSYDVTNARFFPSPCKSCVLKIKMDSVHFIKNSKIE